tara:strand:+ start:530 stop:1021 length:492 start_codon:yes stop_codon:yes gene_type:complete
MNKNSLNKEVIMEYKKHKCCGKKCDCFEISRVINRIKSVTYYQAYNATKEAYVFLSTFLHDCSASLRSNRIFTSFIQKSLPPNIDHSSDTQGIPEPWTQAPPRRNTFKIFHTIMNDHRNSIWRFKVSIVFGDRGVINAPLSAKASKYVYEFIHRENQKKSISI